jgi:predicted dienelactone hydrolase
MNISSGRRLIPTIAAMMTLSATCGAQDRIAVQRSDGAQTPLLVYETASAECNALAVFSPGAGGTENGYAYLAQGLSGQGWLVLVMGHKESGPKTLRHEVFSQGIHGGLKDMVTSREMQQDRMLDLTAALNWSAQRCPHAYRVLLGHSMGSDTVMFEAGARNLLEIQGANRFDAYVAISPSGHGSIFPSGAWHDIQRPLYVLSGTRDTGLEGNWQWRTEPFEDLPSGCHWLGVIDGATHMNFAGVGMAGATKHLTLDSIAAFLERARSGQCAAPALGKGISLQSKSET